MAIITPGTGGTLKKSTAEGQLLELLTLLQITEAQFTNTLDAIQISYNLDLLIASSVFAIPASESIDGNGAIIRTASNYLTSLTFSPGTGGTFKSANAAQYLMELIGYLQSRENDPAKNPSNFNKITSNFDGDTNLFSGTVSLDVDVTLDNTTGNTIIYAKEYLDA